MSRTLFCAALIACSAGKSDPVDDDGDGFSRESDCGDNDPTVFPGAPELCDGVDNNCDGLIDDADPEVSLTGLNVNIAFFDADNDGFGDADSPVGFCEERPQGSVENALDCDDNLAEVAPNQREICDQIDNDCDSLVDDEDPSLDASTGTAFYSDHDGDGYGNPNNSVFACTISDELSTDNTDCDDNEAQRNPSLREDCDDFLDNDCDFFVDVFDTDCISEQPFQVGMSLLGPQRDARAGTSVAGLDDINQDSWPDLIIGAPGVGDETGAAYLYRSRSDITSSSLYHAHYVFRGAEPKSRAGIDVASAGDVDGDNRTDVLIGADHFGLHESNTGSGAAYLFTANSLFAPGERSIDDAPHIIVGQPGEAFGRSLSGVGDTNGDGFDEFVVSAPGNSTWSASNPQGVYLFRDSTVPSSSADATYRFALNPTSDESYFVGQLGDFNGDGFDDIVVGAPDNRGSVHIWFGGFTIGNQAEGAVLSSATADVHFIPESNTDFAHHFASVGDVDQDGTYDILIGAPKNDTNGNDSGRVYLIMSSEVPASGTLTLATTNTKLNGHSAGDNFGYVHSSGDLDRDGILDLLIGAPGTDNVTDSKQDVGTFYTFLGYDFDSILGTTSEIETVASQQLQGDQTELLFGSEASMIGDIDRNGFPDIAIGSASANGPRPTSGRVYISGLRTDGCQEPLDCFEVCDDGIDNEGDEKIDCEDEECQAQAACQLIEHCSDGVDNDGNGGVDCVDPACFTDATCSLDVSMRFLGEAASDRAGFSIGSAGDVSGDGLDDILIGAPNHSEPHNNNGRVYLIYSEDLNGSMSFSLFNSSFSFSGEANGDLAGQRIGSIGDVDQDGLDDIIITAPNNNINGEDSGRAYLIYGSTVLNTDYNINLANADVIINGETAGALLGKDMDTHFDVDGDGILDLVLSSRGQSMWQQPVNVAHIIPGSLLSSPGVYNVSQVSVRLESAPISGAEELLDGSVAAIGDMDGDGLDEIALGAPGSIEPYFECGGAFIRFGSSLFSADYDQPDLHVYGEYSGQNVGIVRHIGDLDGDGLADLGVGYSNSIESGFTIHHGNHLGIGSTAVSNADGTFQVSGRIFASFADIGGDGIGDLIFSDDNHMYLFEGTQFPSYGEVQFPLTEAAHRFELLGGPHSRVGNAGDIDGDGKDEILITNLNYNNEQGEIKVFEQ